MKVKIMGLPVTYTALKQGLMTIFMAIRASQIPVFGSGLCKVDTFARMTSGTEIRRSVIGIHNLQRHVGLVTAPAIRIFHGLGMGLVTLRARSRFRMPGMTLRAFHLRMFTVRGLHLLSRLGGT